MPSETLVLGFDTSAAHCAAALLRGDTVLVARHLDMGRGQAEHLMPLLQGLLDETGHDWSDLTAIGVGIGPGNFTGIRISVSAARGLALGLEIEAVGVSTFDAIQLLDPGAVAAVPAPRDQLYIKTPGAAPQMVAATDAPEVTLPPLPADLAVAIARSAARAPKGPRPAPLYIKPADAAPSRDAPPVILDLA